MVVMSLAAYEQNLFESEIYLKLKEAEYQAASVKKRYTHNEVMTELLFYAVENKKIEIHRIIYSRRDIVQILKEQDSSDSINK